MRKYGRIDGNMPEIVRDLRKLGVSVVSTAPVGNGFGDLVCGARRRNAILEIKDPAQVSSKRALTEAEQEFHDNWRGQIDVVETIDEAIVVLKREGLL